MGQENDRDEGLAGVSASEERLDTRPDPLPKPWGAKACTHTLGLWYPQAQRMLRWQTLRSGCS